MSIEIIKIRSSVSEMVREREDSLLGGISSIVQTACKKCGQSPAAKGDDWCVGCMDVFYWLWPEPTEN